MKCLNRVKNTGRKYRDVSVLGKKITRPKSSESNARRKQRHSKAAAPTSTATTHWNVIFLRDAKSQTLGKVESKQHSRDEKQTRQSIYEQGSFPSFQLAQVSLPLLYMCDA